MDSLSPRTRWWRWDRNFRLVNSYEGMRRFPGLLDEPVFVWRSANPVMPMGNGGHSIAGVPPRVTAMANVSRGFAPSGWAALDFPTIKED
jgi:hypothetical protein